MAPLSAMLGFVGVLWLALAVVFAMQGWSAEGAISALAAPVAFGLAFVAARTALRERGR